ncbi:CrcB family protein [Streptomyces sp. H27-C3]|uniref:fluoride efflux transporter FluC n=1 Tax=Streptomyces sp. H27-C3 TaxID=3046305 RepID=UPI0024B8C60C|nr:CrcB family protein [Streptomyces sp. H27-C3]MDJ0463526.1 CrcB family protein [Streptomyces sp. H27-C3]
MSDAIDPDVDLRVPAHRAETTGRGKWLVLGAISVGGALGALARYGAALLWPGSVWTTFGVNVLGSALIGVLMVLVSEWGRGHALVRPFLGVGVLGGFTTFSTYAADVARLLDEGAAVTAMTYAAGTFVAALSAVWLAASVTGSLVTRVVAR